MTVRRTRQTPERYELGAMWLYREDLQSIAVAVNELGKLTIDCVSGSDTYEASEAADFEGLPENLDSVTISSLPSDPIPRIAR